LFNVDKSIISQNAGTSAASIVVALINQGEVKADEVLDVFEVIRTGMVNGVIELAGGEPADTPAPSGNSGGGRSFGGGKRSGGRANDNGAGVVLNFGEHKGKTIQQVFEEDSSYIEWLAKSSNNDFIRNKTGEFLAANAA